MRKLNTPIAGACVAAILAVACPRATAQTTFAATNDPSTSIRVETTAGDETLVLLTRANASRTAAPFSARTVLRDPSSGISYEMRGYRAEVSKDGRLEVIRAYFRGFEAPLERFDLIDPVAKQQTLYISQIATGEAITASVQ